MHKLSDSKDSLVLESSLQVFFYDELQSFNRKSTNPLSNDVIYYSSLVMDHFGDANKYFEKVDGRVREKILGIKLMESSHLSKDKQKMVVKDIAETALFLCGYFSDSLNKKILDTKYYQDVGKMAYDRLNIFSPHFCNTQDFFKLVSKDFQKVTVLMNLVSSKLASDPYDNFLILSDKKIS